MGTPVGDDFQKETKYIRKQMLSGSLDWANKPEMYKSYPNSRIVRLPSQLGEVKAALSETLMKRKSIRAFSSQSMSQLDLAFLLWASTGIQRIEHGYEFRVAPSAGALYPIETYICANNVEGVAEGIYHYNIKENSLEEVKAGHFGDAIAHASLDQTICAIAPVVFIWSAMFGRSKWKYHQRAYRYVYLDAGHIAQNLALTATSINCGSCQVGAFYDDEINSILGLDGVAESVIYLSVVGHRK